MSAEVNKQPVERIYPNDTRVKPQTIAHHMARYRFALLQREATGNSLDIACGTGYGTAMLARAGYQARGCDISEEALQYAQREYGNLAAYWRQDLSERQLRFPGRYNLVTFFEAIEHISPRSGLRVIQRAYDVLNEGGVMMISTPKDINHENNGWHRSEWNAENLERALGKRFRRVDIYAQDWDTAHIMPYDPKEADFYVAVAQK